MKDYFDWFKTHMPGWEMTISRSIETKYVNDWQEVKATDRYEVVVSKGSISAYAVSTNLDEAYVEAMDKALENEQST